MAAGRTTLRGGCSTLGSFLLGGFPGWQIGPATDGVGSKNRSSGGLCESLLHILMFAEGALPLALTLLAETNPLVVSTLAASAVVHETTANWDLRIAHDSDRDISALEQQVHTALEVIPFLVCLLSALRMRSKPDTAEGRWRLRRKTQPLPAAYVATVLLATGVIGVLPHLEELWRCIRTAASNAGGRPSD